MSSRIGQELSLLCEPTQRDPLRKDEVESINDTGSRVGLLAEVSSYHRAVDANHYLTAGDL